MIGRKDLATSMPGSESGHRVRGRVGGCQAQEHAHRCTARCCDRRAEVRVGRGGRRFGEQKGGFEFPC